MREAIGALALAAMLAGCATAPSETAALRAPTGQADFATLSCRQITAELDVTQKAYSRATGRLQRPALTGEPMASLFAPIAYSSDHPTQAARLKVRLDELQRASRAKRCASSGPKTATA